MSHSLFPLFNDRRLLEDYGLTSDYIERIDVVRDLVPADVETLLDVGCGKGEIINTIAEQDGNMVIIGTDISSGAFPYVKTETCLARLPELPFRDKTFDLVLCLQVLEHLDEEEYVFSLQELQRVSRRYLIIGVPFNENLMLKQVLCAGCGNISNVDGHLRSYDYSDLNNLFNEFVIEREILAGVLQRRQSKIGVWLRQKISGIYYTPDVFTCSYCGCNQPQYNTSRKHILIVKLIGLINMFLTKISNPKPYWIISLYERKNV